MLGKLTKFSLNWPGWGKCWQSALWCKNNHLQQQIDNNCIVRGDSPLCYALFNIPMLWCSFYPETKRNIKTQRATTQTLRQDQRPELSVIFHKRGEMCLCVYGIKSCPLIHCIAWCGSHLWFEDMKQSDLAGINVACRQENTRAKWWSEVALELIIIFIGMPWFICWQVRSYSNRTDHVTCSCWVSRREDSSKNMKYTASTFAFN